LISFSQSSPSGGASTSFGELRLYPSGQHRRFTAPPSIERSQHHIGIPESKRNRAGY
jgi:hypothetical protein